jgi:hypothetical protein
MFTNDFPYGDGVCSSCRVFQRIKDNKKTWDTLTTPSIKNKQVSLMKKGEIRKLPKANSPMWTTQWSVMGSIPKPYVVSRRDNDALWACSCPSWAKHTPREDCKHILSVKLSEKIPVMPATPGVGSMSPELALHFKKFLKQQGALAQEVIKEQGPKPMTLFEQKGRKFR